MVAAARFHRFAWLLLGYNLLVILWGAFVRATGSGAGCGSHWPTCNGEVVPRATSTETVIEFTHRLSSALDGVLVLALLVWAFRVFPRRHPVRLAAVGSFVFLVSEALLGAGLVRFELVADDASTARALVMAAHLVNTFLLLAWLAATAAWSRRAPDDRRRALAAAADGPAAWVLAAALLAMLVLGVSGAVAALGDTLFPSGSFREGLARDFSPTAHVLLRLRIWHPVLALGVGLGIAYAAAWLRRRRPQPEVRRWSAALVGLFALQLALGAANVLLAAPVWMQLVHLLAADLVWICLVLLALAALEPAAEPAGAPA